MPAKHSNACSARTHICTALLTAHASWLAANPAWIAGFGLQLIKIAYAAACACNLSRSLCLQSTMQQYDKEGDLRLTKDEFVAFAKQLCKEGPGASPRHALCNPT